MNPNSRLGPALAGMMLLLACTSGAPVASAQTTLTPWGNLAGMRISGEPLDFDGSLRLVHPDWTGFSSSVKYLQRPRYLREGPRAVVESRIEGVDFREVLHDLGPGEARLELEWTSRTNLSLAGIYYCLDLPDHEFAGGTLEWLGPESRGGERRPLEDIPAPGSGRTWRFPAVGIRAVSERNTIEVRWQGALPVVARREASTRPLDLNDPAVRQSFVPRGPANGPTGSQVYVELSPGDVGPGRSARITLEIKASARPDTAPVQLVVVPSRPGRPFAGIGGNFRLQFPETDPAVIRYNLDHLRIAWGRFDLPWAEWDPEETRDPLVAARAGQLHPRVAAAIGTGRTLARRGVPLMVSAWVPPKWARAPEPQPTGLRGTALDMGKLDRICASLTASLVFLKEHAGIEAAYFSFNEPETGVEVRQTPSEHVRFLQTMGPHLARSGLRTRLLLGDTAHGTPAALDFIRPALADLAARPAIGAIAFHTWRGCTPADLGRWAEAARQLGVPLMVTEAGPDAHLHEYPAVRREPWFQLQEIELYLRICAAAQPETIMAWQLTTDYSVLGGGGVYGEPGPLSPTQRFWNLAQLATTPPGAFALPISSDRPEVTPAAFGDLLDGRYSIHVVNRGAQRRAILRGLPASVSALRRLTTDAARGMETGEPVPVRDGQAEVTLPEASYTTLANDVPGR